MKNISITIFEKDGKNYLKEYILEDGKENNTFELPLDPESYPEEKEFSIETTPEFVTEVFELYKTDLTKMYEIKVAE